MELILHHYDISPYAEKIRAIMGFKGLAWRSVHIPVVMPKPDLTALTGGYRLTPVLQIGADIYCDTKVIARRLESERCAPTLYPDGFAAFERATSLWGEGIFMSLVTVGLGMGMFPDDFVKDRMKMVPGGFDADAARAALPSRLDHRRANLDLLEAQLGDARPFLLGPRASFADFSVYHPLWAMRSMPASATALERCPRATAWMDRIAELGHGTATEMSSADAVEVARAATPQTQSAEDADDPNHRRVGDRIRLFPEAYGRDPVEGELVRADAHSVAIRRHDARAGDVVVHFPREGMIILGP